MSLTHADVRKILKTLDESEHYDYVEITIGDYVLKAGKTAGAFARQPAVPEATPELATDEPNVGILERKSTAKTSNENQDDVHHQDYHMDKNMVAVRSPMTGIFYDKPRPEEPPFVEEGGRVEPGQTVCLVEVMKLFNMLEAPVSGTIHKIVAVHGEPVELNSILMIIAPDDTAGKN